MGKEKNIKPFRIVYKFLGLVFPISYLIFNKNFALFFVLAFIILYSLFDFVRLTNKKVNKWVFKNIGFLVKDKEKKKVSTALSLLIASLIVIFLFERNTAIVSLFIFTVGDASGNIFGKRFNKIKMFDKSLEGNLACFVLSFLAGIVLARFLDFSLFKVFIGALTATIIQALPLKIDDNFTMPIAAAIAMSLLK